jgi:tRNA-specific 2-thiouridylase
VCNNWLKFGKLWKYGRQLDADFIATGHYVRAGRRNGEFELLRAVDPGKDQSYVLFGLQREILPHLLFPLGNYHKNEVRALAREAKLGVAAKPDSVEICFVPNNDHADFIRRRRPDLATAGVFRDRAGNVLAEHDGYEQYTIGQRKGLGFGSASRRYVLEIVPETHDVILGDRDDLLAAALTATRVNWLIDPPSAPLPCQAKIRYRHEPAAATVTALADGGARVDFETLQSAVTPGQAIVFYAGARVLGGGWIEEALGR